MKRIPGEARDFGRTAPDFSL